MTKKNILVVGDSFIDENWLMSKIDVYHSYNVGQEHYLSILPGSRSSIISFCGVAGIMRVLYGSDEPQTEDKYLKNKYDLIGLSAWNPRDEQLLKCLLCSRYPDKPMPSPYTLSGLAPVGPLTQTGTSHSPANSGKPTCPNGGDPCTFPLILRNLIKQGDLPEGHVSTNRLYRVYEGFGSDQPKLIYRFDWRLDINTIDKDYDVIDEIKKKHGDLAAIVILDHGYGVVDESLIKRLGTTFKQAKWYVRCKLESAEWQIRQSRKKPFRLLFSDEQLLNYKYGHRQWRYGSATLGRGALEVLGDLVGLRKYIHTHPDSGEARSSNKVRSEIAAVLFENDTVIAALDSDPSSQMGQDAFIANLDQPPGPKQPILVGRSSVFFASLVYWDLVHAEITKDSLHQACEWALQNCYDWSKGCTAAWLNKEPKLSGPFEKAIYSNPTPGDVVLKEPIKYEKSWKDWNDSSKGLGIIYPGSDDQQIQLWRSKGVLKSYICPGGLKRSEINSLIKRLDDYRKNPRPKHPFNCLLLAEPGWGKSFLARSIADHFGFESLFFSIAEMASNQELISSFKMIASTQNRVQKRLLVFIDEMDAKIENHSAMGLLIGPIWDGSFKADGNIYRIEPCIWFFASTKPVTRLIQESKGRDFISRINGPIIDLDFFRSTRELIDQQKDEPAREKALFTAFKDEENEPLRTEMVYICVEFLNKMFGPISAIDRSVLQLFHSTYPINGVRSLEIFISRFKSISGGKVYIRNVPRLADFPELERHIRPLGVWPTEDSKDEIKVMIHPL